MTAANTMASNQTSGTKPQLRKRLWNGNTCVFRTKKHHSRISAQGGRLVRLAPDSHQPRQGSALTVNESVSRSVAVSEAGFPPMAVRVSVRRGSLAAALCGCAVGPLCIALNGGSISVLPFTSHATLRMLHHTASKRERVRRVSCLCTRVGAGHRLKSCFPSRSQIPNYCT